ncbi:MAG TPA: hypothetical protein VF771_03910 [Longimicrobiaceae bacterium]
MHERLRVASDQDWEQLRARGLDTVVDPMVFRTADVFLAGASGTARARPPRDLERTWEAISSNLGSLCTFFDTLVLEEEHLPVFDYEMTFPTPLPGGSPALLDLCNEYGEVLVPVSVGYTAFREISEAALQALGTLPPVPDAVAEDIANELSAFDWDWRPVLAGRMAGGEREQLLDAFRFGGLLFSGYTQRIGGTHVLQPKRARLYLEAALGTREEAESQIFARLETLVQRDRGSVRTGDLPAAPTVLPYLLQADERSPRALLERAFRLRRSGAVSDYRAWRDEARADLEKGRLRSSTVTEVERIAAAVQRDAGGSASPEAKLKLSAKLVLGLAPSLQLTAEKEASLGGQLGWVLDRLPGRRHRKLLQRLIGAQREYFAIDRHLKMVWQEG